jgi:type 1 fimbriae regulatory protein FimB
VDTESRVLHVARLKKGLSTTQRLRGDELRAIKAWLAIRTYGQLAGLPLDAHPHMLSHACGLDQGADTRLIQDYLGHRNMQHTVRYTATNPARFERLWR